MILVRILVNALIMALELALIAAVAFLAWQYPVLFAAFSGAVGFVLGLGLERARLANELTFYLGSMARPLSWFTSSVALGEAVIKGVLAGVAALLTFSGTDAGRLWWVAVVFAACLFAGTNLLRGLRVSLNILPARWGYFRLAAPLGLLFSAALTVLMHIKVLPPHTLGDLTRRLVMDTPARPSIAQASELLYVFKQYFDEVVVSLLANFMSREAATLVGILLSVNMLTGFVIAIYAVIIADIVRRLEGGL